VNAAKIIIRPCNTDDKNLIYSDWLKGQYWGSEYFGKMDQDQYFFEYAKHITNLICKPGTMIDCAVLEDQPNFVVGFIVYNDQKLHWAYVKKAYRKQGLLNLLLKNMDFTEFSGHTKAGLAIGKKKGLQFNPF
jgi:hypothetical protein